jgi:peptidoglycan/xylan/chitin deacetylase (PgdA/CDA1 family)/SAM-dependent methyltransferase
MYLDAGDAILPDYHEQALRVLEASPQIDIVTSPIQWLGPGSARQTTAPHAVHLAGLLGRTDAIHDASVFRREAWAAAGGFDETLPSLECFDLWLRILSRDRRCELLARPMLVRAVREDALYRRDWESELESFDRILGKHAALFTTHVADALYSREMVLIDLGPRYLAAVARRDEAVTEIEGLKASSAELLRQYPDIGGVDLGDLDRRTPVSREWGYERGTPIDRYYIERFLEKHSSDIKGRVLEVQEADYTRKFGTSRVERSDVLDLDPANARATIIADLRSAGNIPPDTFDCIILTQTVHVIDDMRAVFGECARILKPGGVLLTTLPSASRVCLEYGHDGDFWRVTEAGARQLLDGIFPSDLLAVESHGNVLVNAAFLYGLGCHELRIDDFEAADPYFPLIISVRAMKPHRESRSIHRPKGGAAILLYHRVASDITDAHGLCIPPGDFDAQMAHLKTCYCPMALSDLTAALASGEVPSGAVAVTFDDGYTDNDLAASPILSRHRVPATFFITTDRLDDGGTEYWWDVLESVLLTPGASLPAALQLSLPGGQRDFPTSSAADRQDAHTQIYGEIVASDFETRTRVIEALIRWSGIRLPARAARRRMSAGEVRVLAARDGHDVGAHSVRHLVLPKQPADVIQHEIATSKRTLEAVLGRSVTAFAYPHGAYDDHVVAEATAASIAVAVTCDETTLGLPVDLLRLPRLEVTPARSSGFDRWLAQAITGAGR